MAAGPLIGGLLTTYASWRWVFAGEVVLVAVILVLARRMADAAADPDAALDLVGTLLSALGLGLVVLGILKAGTWGFVNPKPGAPSWAGLSPVVWLVLAGTFVIWAFLAWENRRSPWAARRCSTRRSCGSRPAQWAWSRSSCGS